MRTFYTYHYELHNLVFMYKVGAWKMQKKLPIRRAL